MTMNDRWIVDIIINIEPVGNLVNLYDTNLKLIVDRHASRVSKEITLRPNTEWHTEELRNAKRGRRKAERRIRNTNLSVHQQMYRDVCVNANKLLLRCKKEYFPTKIEEAERSLTPLIWMLV
jgi:hypothetical protein